MSSSERMKSDVAPGLVELTSPRTRTTMPASRTMPSWSRVERTLRHRLDQHTTLSDRGAVSWALVGIDQVDDSSGPRS